MFRVFLLGLGLTLAAPPALARWRLFPSSAPVRGVVLQYLSNDALPKSLPNPRGTLIREVRRDFPSLPIHLTSDVTREAFAKREPDLASAVQAFVTIGRANNVQDPFELLWDSAARSLGVLSFPRYEAYRPLVKAIWPGARVIALPDPGPDRAAGGNLEVLPDGTPVIGDTFPETLARRLAAETGRSAIRVPASWTGSQDVDEVVLFAADPRQAGGCVLFVLDTAAGARLAQSDRRWERETIATRVDLAGRLVPGLTQTQREQVEAQAREQVGEIAEALSRGQRGLSEIQAAIDAASRHLRGCRRVSLPVAYARSGEPGRYGYLFNNAVNSLVIGSHVYSLDPGYSGQREAVESIFRENGFRVHWISPFGFEAGGGNMHCNSFTIRGPDMH